MIATIVIDINADNEVDRITCMDKYGEMRNGYSRRLMDKFPEAWKNIVNAIQSHPELYSVNKVDTSDGYKYVIHYNNNPVDIQSVITEVDKSIQKERQP